jgi:hypothetical protein
MGIFKLGDVIVTSNVNKHMMSTEFEEFVKNSLDRHSRNDYGEMCEDDKMMNDLATIKGGRIFSSYHIIDANIKEDRIWIITTGDREYTSVMFPHEY